MLKINLNPFPELTTSRLVLRRIMPTDSNDVFKLRSDESLMRFIPRHVARSVDDAEKLIQQMSNYIYANEAITWGIERKDSPGIIGTVGYIRIDKENHRAEIGYMLDSRHHRQGIMDEAIKAAISYGFHELKFHSIEALINPLNAASAKVALKNGFTKTASFKDYLYFIDRYVDVDVYYRVK
jgi:[ribosomal protein S5]-alanine N-acetyltransferase